MLTHLSIRNYALIRELEIDLSKGLTVLTGETGSGKSIVLGALGLIRGERADRTVLFDQSSKCMVEATFDVSGYALKAWFEQQELDHFEECLMRREIAPGGRSRAFINDIPVQLNQMRELAGYLIDIHSQDHTSLLGNSQYRFVLLDSLGKGRSIFKQYAESWKAWVKAKEDLDRLLAEQREANDEADYRAFQLKELESVELDGLDFDELQRELNEQSNAEEIVRRLSGIVEIVNSDGGIQYQLRSARNELSAVSEFLDPDWNERLNSVMIELQDLTDTFEQKAGSLDVDPAQLQLLTEKFDKVQALLQKHYSSSIEELIGKRNELKAHDQRRGYLEQEIEALERSSQEHYDTLLELGQSLSAERELAANILSGRIEQVLWELAMPDSKFMVEVSRSETPGPLGLDQVRFLFSANDGVAPAELKKVASGGEKSRLMLAVKKVLAESEYLPTLILDEIDTGVSGEVARKMAGVMREMSSQMQLICITHLPQIASAGAHHFKVYKTTEGETVSTRLVALGSDERLKEIAVMLSGDPPTPSAKENAKELLATLP